MNKDTRCFLTPVPPQTFRHSSPQRGEGGGEPHGVWTERVRGRRRRNQSPSLHSVCLENIETERRISPPLLHSVWLENTETEWRAVPFTALCLPREYRDRAENQTPLTALCLAREYRDRLESSPPSLHSVWLENTEDRERKSRAPALASVVLQESRLSVVWGDRRTPRGLDEEERAESLTAALREHGSPLSGTGSASARQF